MKAKKIMDAEIRKHIDRSFMNGILKLQIMHKIKCGKDYPYAIMKDIKKHPHGPVRDVTKNEVYNTISALENGGYIKGNTRVSGGKIQRRYVLTPSGRRMVERSRKILIRHITAAKRLMADFNE